MDNYSEKFSTLLYVEEIQREIDIRQFDLTSVSKVLDVLHSTIKYYAAFVCVCSMLVS